MTGPGSQNGWESHSEQISEAIKTAIEGLDGVTSVEQDCDEIIVTWDNGGQSNVDVDSHDYIGY